MTSGYFDFSLAVWTKERHCVVCSEPGSNAHHVLRRGSPWHGDSIPENGVMLCGSGTTGCHGEFHNGNRAVAVAIGEYVTEHRPDVVAYAVEKLGREAAIEFFRRVYGTEVTP